MHELNVLNAFIDEDGNHGNPVGILVDEDGKLDIRTRQAVSLASGFSETVFISDVASLTIHIHNPKEEITFAGHATVAAAWFLKHVLEKQVTQLQGREGLIEAWSENDLTWVKCELRLTPPWWHEYVADVAKLEALSGPEDPSQTHTQLWTWIDSASGIIRSRTFAAEWGIPEDEANGSGCMRLAAALGRSLKVIHGRGSVIYARPHLPGSAAVGGRVAIKEKRNIEL